MSETGKFLVFFFAPVVVVDEVAKTGGINDGQMQTNTILFDIWWKAG